MLILTRALGEEIVVGEGENRVVIIVMHLDRGRVRLGIQCDRSIPIFRSELLERGEPIRRKAKEEGD